ncbi:hypothetical protein [Sediminibacillus massiliensis]|uniref:hypothetical protein n=1 Tax=Sediminibacillus massiliensis TaxID=1926277 RepID=UPI0009884884|nr:hypothetical protein [Sediminibacillus massiliensis]
MCGPIKTLKLNGEEIILFESDLFFHEDNLYGIVVTSEDITEKFDELGPCDGEITLSDGVIIKVKLEVDWANYPFPTLDLTGPIDNPFDYPEIDYIEEDDDWMTKYGKKSNFKPSISLEEIRKLKPPHTTIDLDDIPIYRHHEEWLKNQENLKEIVEKALKEYINKLT